MTLQVKLAYWSIVWLIMVCIWYFFTSQDDSALIFIGIFALISFRKFVLGIKPRKVKRNRLRDAIKHNNDYQF